MCNLSQGLIELGEARGEARVLLSYMGLTGCSREEALAALGVTGERVPAVVEWMERLAAEPVG